MMLKSLLRHGLMVLLLLAVAVPVYAGGSGLFVSGGEVEAEWDADLRNVNADGQHHDFGFSVGAPLVRSGNTHNPAGWRP